MYLLICSIIHAGMGRVHMKKVGRLENNDLIRDNFSPDDKRVEQPESLLSILWSMGTNSSFLGLTKLSGIPKYVIGNVPMLHPSPAASELMFSSSTLIGTMTDLPKLILSPVNIL